MSIIAKAKEGKEFVLVPAETMQAVCFDVHDIGLQRQMFGDKVNILHKIWIMFEVAELMPEGTKDAGKRMVIGKKYTLSLSAKSILKKDLESWRGRPFTPEELAGFDIEKLIGVNCMISVVHNESKDKTKKYANIATISKLMKGLTPFVPENKRSDPDWIKELRAKAVTPKAEAAVTESTPQYDEDGQIVSSDEPDETEPPF